VQPPVDRHRPPDEAADVYVHVEEETDAGLVISGAKVVATGSALTHANFHRASHDHPHQEQSVRGRVHRRDGHPRRQAGLPQKRDS
jgi:4-hydroxyphenylacetate 3-monooxygenase